MKKILFRAITLSIIYFGLGGTALAEEPLSTEEKAFSPSVSMKMWVNTWSLPVNGSETANQIWSFRSDTEFAFIPVLSARFDKFFVSGSYFSKTDYEFGTQTLYIPIQDQVAVGKLNISATRSEWDLNLGYYLHPSLAITAGYKEIKRDFTLTLPEVPQPNNTMDGGYKSNGFTLGVGSVVPIQNQFNLYGNFAVGRLMDGSSNSNSNYYLGELGFLYGSRFETLPALESASVYIGYRFQALKDDIRSGNSATNGATDTTDGFVLGVNLSF